MLRPDEFAAQVAREAPDAAARAVQVIARRHRLPRHTDDEIVDLLVTRYGMKEVADIVRPLI